MEVFIQSVWPIGNIAKYIYIRCYFNSGTLKLNKPKMAYGRNLSKMARLQSVHNRGRMYESCTQEKSWQISNGGINM